MTTTLEGPGALGARLRQLRRERRLTQRALAGAINASQSSVCKWERGAAWPEYWMLIELAKVLRADIAWLTGMEKTI